MFSVCGYIRVGELMMMWFLLCLVSILVVLVIFIWVWMFFDSRVCEVFGVVGNLFMVMVGLFWGI